MSTQTVSLCCPSRPAAPAAEWNHSCTSQCPSPCKAAQSVLDRGTELRGEACLAPNDCQWPACPCYPQRGVAMACQAPEKCYFPSCTCSRPSAA